MDEWLEQSCQDEDFVTVNSARNEPRLDSVLSNENVNSINIDDAKPQKSIEASKSVIE